MHKLELFIKALILAMAEYMVEKRVISTSLIEKVIETPDTRRNKVKTFNDENDIMDKLKILISSILTGDVIPTSDIMISIEIILTEKQNFIKLIEKYVFKKSPEPTIKLVKEEIRRELKRNDAKTMLSFALSRILKPNTDVDKILDETGDVLSGIKEMKGLVDVSLVDEVDFDNRDSVKAANDKAKELVSGGKSFITGWSAINTMTQGGPRRGEFVTVSALRHNYKSSLIKSMFIQMLRLNKAVPTDTTKRPMFVFISLEEEVDNIMFFFYAYLKFSIESIEIADNEQKNLNTDEMTDYVMKHCLENGFSIRIYRFIPELFGFSKLFSVIEKLERQGFEVQGTFLDYVKKMSREGCNRNGPSGTDLLELFSRLRGYFSSKNILFITPHQLNTQANALIRTGLPAEEFVKHIADKNYYADSAQLGQEIDLELFLHKGKINKQMVLYVSRGKHRLPTNIPEEDKLTILKFTSKVAPIPEESEVHDVTITSTTINDEFDF
ncbi:MAG: hypothetical protein DRN14_03895 [Thermoplasmata archaeon]|nr:MAG: hypothetical protein DRN14_03895 [Thermoplasmata archaeon]